MTDCSLPSALYLGVDQGSSSTRGELYTESGERIWSEKIQVSSQTVSKDQITQDPEELLHSVQRVISGAFKFSKDEKLPVVAVGIACQRSGVCAWDESGVLSPLYTWRNRIAMPLVEALSSDEIDIIRDRTFLNVIPDYAAPKIAMLQQSYPKASVATLDTFLCHNLCAEGPFVTDHTMASRTMLYDVRRGLWDKEICGFFKVDSSRLPVIMPTQGYYGTIEGIPLHALAGDNQSATLGLMQSDASAALNMGTVTSVCIPTGNKLQIHPGYPSGILNSTPEERLFFVEGLITSSGSQVDFLQDRFDITLTEMAECLKQTRFTSCTGYFPFRGTGSPLFRYDVPFLLNVEPPDSKIFIRAVLEHLAFSVTAIINDFIKNRLISAGDTIIVAGGLSRFEGILQIIQQLTSLRLLVSSDDEATVKGAALTAASSKLKQRVEWNTRTENVEQANSTATEERFKIWSSMKKAALTGKDDFICINPEDYVRRFRK